MIAFGLLALIGCAAAFPDGGKIVGGRDADIRDYPHQVAFLYYGGQICGGSIISKDWVLTAAHCTKGKDVTKISFRAGSTDKTQGGTVVQAAAIYDHPDYSPQRNNDYDFSLIKVKRPFTLQGNVKAIALARSAPADGEVTTVTGWGTLSSGGNAPRTLMQVDVNVVARSTCNYNYGGVITDRMLCAAAGGKDSCQGDSGGPLITKNGGQNTLVGVVSWGAGCADSRYPGVYSNVASVRDWISSTTGVFDLL